jgi:hypothetical protein
MSKFELLTLIVAGYGALLSSILAVLEFIKNKRKLRVSCTVWPLSSLLVIHAVNIGHRPVIINNLGFEISNGHNLDAPFDIFDDPFKPVLPKKLKDGEDFAYSFHFDELQDGLKGENDPKVKYTKIFVMDSESHYYKAKLPKELKDLEIEGVRFRC